MSKTYHLKLVGGKQIDIQEEQFRGIEADVMARTDRMVSAGGAMFSAKEVRLVTSSWKSNMPDGWQEEHPEITEEQRQKNLDRMAIIKDYLFSGQKSEWMNPYGPDSIRSTFSREELRALRKEFFDVYFETSDQEDRAARYWILYHRGTRDPRLFNRQTAINFAYKVTETAQS